MSEGTLELHQPAPNLAASFERFRDAVVATGEAGWTAPGTGVALTDVHAYIAAAAGWANGQDVPEGWVPSSTFWIVENGEVAGELVIRHALTPWLREMGGNIGYLTHPEHRGRGIATFALREGLEILANMGLPEALITCAESNAASVRVIEKCGGVRIEDATRDGFEARRRYVVRLVHEHGMLDVGDGNSIYWECSGNPRGFPAVYIHGGPGAGCTPGARRYFDPERYRVILFDQRGCGRSRPLLSEKSQLQTNTTQHLIRDLETLREHLSIERWVMLGISWGTTLALAYAQAYPQHVAALVLACLTTTSRREVDWITSGVGCMFPQQWERFAGHIPPSLKGERIVDAYAELLFDDDPSVCATAAAEWCVWEDAHVSLAPGSMPNPRFADPEFRLRFARFVTHYWRHAAFLEDEQLLRNAALLNGIPGVLIHGRYDISSPLETAWRLHKAWATSELRVLDDAGHGRGSMPARVIAALNMVSW